MDDAIPIPLDAETKVAERPADHEAELRLWLRLLTCTTLIEGEVRRRLRDEFDVTLPRFDLMAQLDKAPNGMTLGELSQRMMVSNGNVTGLAERLVEQGLLDRRPSPNDRRAQIVSLTAEGRRAFRAMARTHEDWIAQIFAGLDAAEIEHADDAAGEDQGLRTQGDERRRRMSANPVTLPLSATRRSMCASTVDGKVATLRSTGPTRRTRSPSRATPRSPTSSAPPRRTSR